MHYWDLNCLGRQSCTFPTVSLLDFRFFFFLLPLKSLSGVPVVCRHGFGEGAQGHLFQAIIIDSVDV